MIREIDTAAVIEAVKKGCIDANKNLPADLEKRINDCTACENPGLAKSVMECLCDNMNSARELDIPVCQDTGMAVVFAEIGRDVHFSSDFEAAVNEGVRQGYTEGYLRKSVVSDPLERVNTGDNTPAVIHTKITEGDKVKLTIAPKGFGSENMSAVKMFTPAATKEDIENFVVETVKNAGSNPCPPVVVGVGIGGTFEKCALLSKQALCRSISVPNDNPYYAEMEKEILDKLNSLNIGPQGFGGKTTALSVAVEVYPTHIAGLPVAVNMGCHVTRHITVTI